MKNALYSNYKNCGTPMLKTWTCKICVLTNETF